MENIIEYLNDRLSVPVYWGLLPDDVDFQTGAVSAVSSFLQKDVVTDMNAEEYTFTVRSNDVYTSNMIMMELNSVLRNSLGAIVEPYGQLQWYFINQTGEVFEQEYNIYSISSVWGLRYIYI